MVCPIVNDSSGEVRRILQCSGRSRFNLLVTTRLLRTVSSTLSASPTGASRPIDSSFSRTFDSASCSHRRWLRIGDSCAAAASLVSATFGSSIRIVVRASLLSAPCAWYPQIRIWLLNRARSCFLETAPSESVSSEYTYDGTHTPGATFTRQPSIWNDNVRLSRPDNSSSVPRLAPLKRTRL